MMTAVKPSRSRSKMPDYTPPKVAMVDQKAEPPLDQGWPDLQKLRWLAALVESETGVRLRVFQSDSQMPHRPQAVLYDLVTPNATTGPAGFQGTWTLLTGVELGAKEAVRLPDGA
jgi:hypothetical protein